MRSRDFPPDLKTLIKHLLISHHGEYEFGSPKLPMFREAWSCIISTIWIRRWAPRAPFSAASGGEDVWTAFSPALNRRLLAGRPVPGPRRAASALPEQDHDTQRGTDAQHAKLDPSFKGSRCRHFGTSGCSRDASLDSGSGSAGTRLHECAVAAGRGHGARRSASTGDPTRPRAYTTIMTILDRLAQKGVVARRKGRPRVALYRPIFPPSEAPASCVARLVDGFFMARRRRLASHVMTLSRTRAEIAELRQA